MIVILVRAAGWLFDDLVDDAEAQQIRRGHAEALRGLLDARAVLPQYRRAAFGRNDAVGPVLEDEYAVGDAERERPTAASLADDRRDDRHGGLRHGREARADRLALPALFGADAGISARGVDERQDREPEPRRHLVHAERLAVALRVRLPEVARHLVLRAPALLVPDDDDGLAVEAGEARDDRRVVAEAAIAVELDPVLEDAIDVVERVGPVLVPRELHLLPRREAREELARELRRLVFEALQLGLERAVGARHFAELAEPRHEVDDGLLERQNMAVVAHGGGHA